MLSRSLDEKLRDDSSCFLPSIGSGPTLTFLVTNCLILAQRVQRTNGNEEQDHRTLGVHFPISFSLEISGEISRFMFHILSNTRFVSDSGPFFNDIFCFVAFSLFHSRGGKWTKQKTRGTEPPSFLDYRSVSQVEDGTCKSV